MKTAKAKSEDVEISLYLLCNNLNFRTCTMQRTMKLINTNSIEIALYGPASICSLN